MARILARLDAARGPILVGGGVFFIVFRYENRDLPAKFGPKNRRFGSVFGGRFVAVGGPAKMGIQSPVKCGRRFVVLAPKKRGKSGPALRFSWRSRRAYVLNLVGVAKIRGCMLRALRCARAAWVWWAWVGGVFLCAKNRKQGRQTDFALYFYDCFMVSLSIWGLFRGLIILGCIFYWFGVFVGFYSHSTKHEKSPVSGA